MKTGFTFNGEHCRDYGITMRSKNRATLPRKEARQIKVPGQQGLYDLGNNTYDNKMIVVDCMVKGSSLETLRLAVRAIAAWISNEGTLIFDDETEKKYKAKLYNQVDFENIIASGFFSLVFEVEPFADGNDVVVTKQLTEPGSIELNYEGTAPACVKITITNNGSTPINGFTLTYGKISSQE